jgi:hypothetical protein
MPPMPESLTEGHGQSRQDLLIRSVDIALAIANINRTAEVQKILADAKKILSFYEKGPIE